MPFSSEHYYLTFGGPLGNQEQWSCGLRLDSANNNGLTQVDEEAALVIASTVLRTEWAKATNPSGSTAGLTWEKLNRIGVDGKYVNDYTNVLDHAQVNSPNASMYPLQVSMAATLTTAAERGLAAKGRLFLPAPWQPLSGPDKTWSTAQCQVAADWVATLIESLNNADLPGQVVIASSTRTGATRSVLGVNVGSVPDTMRSRRNKQAEIRITNQATITPPIGGDF